MLDDILAMNRRGFLQHGAGAVALASVTAAANAALLPANSGKLLVLFQPSDAASTAFAALLRAQGVPTRELSLDVVRQWRDELRAVRLADGVRLIGLTPYADYFMLRGLAAEERVFPLVEQPTNSGADTAQLKQVAAGLFAQLDGPPTAATPATAQEPLFSWIL